MGKNGKINLLHLRSTHNGASQNRNLYFLCVISFSFPGNIMNSGSKNAQSVGFDISYLPKMSNTKDRENKATLLHFLVEDVERNHPVISRIFCLRKIKN